MMDGAVPIVLEMGPHVPQTAIVVREYVPTVPVPPHAPQLVTGAAKPVIVVRVNASKAHAMNKHHVWKKPKNAQPRENVAKGYIVHLGAKNYNAPHVYLMAPNANMITNVAQEPVTKGLVQL